ncbi:hypothetical protein ACOME3_000369 [Neoechinorhynchus agilis]
MRFKKMNISKIASRYDTTLACQLLRVCRIPTAVEDILEERGEGIPVQIEQILYELLMSGCVKIVPKTTDSMNFSEPIPELMISINGDLFHQSRELTLIPGKEDTLNKQGQRHHSNLMVTFDRLSGHSQRILKISAMIGYRFEVSAVKYVLRDNEYENIRTGFRELFSQGFVTCAYAKNQRKKNTITATIDSDGHEKEITVSNYVDEMTETDQSDIELHGMYNSDSDDDSFQARFAGRCYCSLNKTGDIFYCILMRFRPLDALRIAEGYITCCIKEFRAYITKGLIEFYENNDYACYESCNDNVHPDNRFYRRPPKKRFFELNRSFEVRYRTIVKKIEKRVEKGISVFPRDIVKFITSQESIKSIFDIGEEFIVDAIEDIEDYVVLRSHGKPKQNFKPIYYVPLLDKVRPEPRLKFHKHDSKNPRRININYLRYREKELLEDETAVFDYRRCRCNTNVTNGYSRLMDLTFDNPDAHKAFYYNFHSALIQFDRYGFYDGVVTLESIDLKTIEKFQKFIVLYLFARYSVSMRYMEKGIQQCDNAIAMYARIDISDFRSFRTVHQIVRRWADDDFDGDSDEFLFVVSSILLERSIGESFYSLGQLVRSIRDAKTSLWLRQLIPESKVTLLEPLNVLLQCYMLTNEHNEINVVLPLSIEIGNLGIRKASCLQTAIQCFWLISQYQITIGETVEAGVNLDKILSVLFDINYEMPMLRDLITNRAIVHLLNLNVDKIKDSMKLFQRLRSGGEFLALIYGTDILLNVVCCPTHEMEQLLSNLFREDIISAAALCGLGTDLSDAEQQKITA